MKNQENKKGNALALLPILVFVVLYLGLGIFFAMNNEDFGGVPILVVFLVALAVACFQNRKVKFDQKLEIMGRGVGDKDIVTMILIFLVAGVFVGVVGRDSAESVAYFMLSVIPPQFAVAVLFVVACFVSTAMGTSCGTISLIVPIAVPVAEASGFSLPLCVASVIGGAMFGDNLSFISDTTIAACNGQNVPMKSKFQKNFFIALPAAVATLVLIIVLSLQADAPTSVTDEYDLIQIIPYVLVLVGGIIGINVFLVLLIGIVSGIVVMLATNSVTVIELIKLMGGFVDGQSGGISNMLETAMVAVLVAAICALIRESGGFDVLLRFIRKTFKGKRGGQFGMGLLVGLLDIATANNTVAIVVANPIAKEMADTYDISPRKTASLLDTFSCIVQGVLPYGAQMLLAIGAVKGASGSISAFEIIPFLFYPMFLLASSVVSILFVPTRHEK